MKSFLINGTRIKIHYFVHCMQEFSLLLEHVKQTKHRLWMELDLGNVYCTSCSDYVYDAELLVSIACGWSWTWAMFTVPAAQIMSTMQSS